MAVEQMNISLSPQMAKFIRRKVAKGGYTNISEVVRTAIRRMQEEETRQLRRALSDMDEVFAEARAEELRRARQGVEAGVAEIERGDYTEYLGRQGLAELVQDVKSRGRRRLAARARKR